MKLASNNSNGSAGVLLIECLVYMVVFAILFGLGTTAFFFCWDHSRALLEATNHMESALHAGERWRADVRGATGKISVETSANGEVVKIPEGRRDIIYRFANGEVRRQAGVSGFPALLLQRVGGSQMKMERRGGVAAWRWELELTQRRPEASSRFWFTFEAAQKGP